MCATKERFGRMALAEAINKDTEWLTFRGWIMKRAKRICPLKRRLSRCDTTHAGELSFQTRWLSTSCTPEILNAHSGPCDCARRSADIALVAGGNRKRWIIATENMQAGDVIKTSAVIGRMAGNDLHQRWGLMDFIRCLTRTKNVFTLQCRLTRVMRTHWELFLWGRWWTIWRYSLGRDRSISVLQVTFYCVYIDYWDKLSVSSSFAKSFLCVKGQVAFCCAK